MEEEQRHLVEKWKGLLCHVLEATVIMDKLPEFFALNSNARSQVETRDVPHEAVEALVNELMAIPNSYHRFLEVMREDYEWLVALLRSENTSDVVNDGMTVEDYNRYVNNFLTIMLPQIIEVTDAIDVVRHLRATGFMSQEDSEKVEAKVNHSGNMSGVRLTLSILARKPIGWQKEFKMIMKRQNYSADLLELMDDMPDCPLSFSQEISYSSVDCSDASMDEEQRQKHDESIKASKEVFIEAEEAENDATCLDALALEHIEEIPLYERNNIIQSDAWPNKAPVRRNKQHLHNWKRQNGFDSVPKPTSSSSSSIIPKEAKYNTRLSRSRQPVRGAESLRKQERELATKPINGENVILWAPEGSDRCRVIVHIIQSRFESIMDSIDRKIAFVANKVTKQHEVIKNCFRSEQWSVGYYNNETTNLRKLMDDCQVIVMSAKPFCDWLSSNSDLFKITEFDLLIIDECDSASQDGPFRNIMIRYQEAKQTRPQDLPQVIGLTSRLGTGQISKIDDAVEHVKNLCALFDVKGGIDVSQDALEVKSPPRRPKSSPAKQNSITGNNCISDPFTWTLCEAIDGIVNLLYKQCIRKVKNLRTPHQLRKGSAEYSKWCDTLQKRAEAVDDRIVKEDIMKCGVYLSLFNEAFSLKNTYRPEDSMQYVENELKRIKHARKCDERVQKKKLLDICDESVAKLRHHVHDISAANAALLEIETKMSEHFTICKTTKALLVVHDEIRLEPLENWLNASSKLERFGFNAKCLKDHLPAAQTKALIQSFAARKTKILIVHLNAFNSIGVSGNTKIFYYNCVGPLYPKPKGKNPKTPESFTFATNPIIADDKVKIAIPLLMRKAVKMIQWRDGELEERQTKLCHQTRGTARSRLLRERCEKAF